jgi:hypothetical protein
MALLRVKRQRPPRAASGELGGCFRTTEYIRTFAFRLGQPARQGRKKKTGFIQKVANKTNNVVFFSSARQAVKDFKKNVFKALAPECRLSCA